MVALKPPNCKQRLVAKAILQQLRDARPADDYRPHDRGQLQFHQSTHTIRGLFPGNGFGKTTAVAAEIDAWCRHTNRWQETPRWPIVAVWFCPQYSQFGLLREQLETDIIGRNIPWQDQRRQLLPISRRLTLVCGVRGSQMDVCAGDQPRSYRVRRAAPH